MAFGLGFDQAVLYLFQIGSEWCKEGRKGGKCNISCEGSNNIFNVYHISSFNMC